MKQRFETTVAWAIALILAAIFYGVLFAVAASAQTPLPPVTITVQPGQQQPINVIAASPTPSPTPTPAPNPCDFTLTSPMSGATVPNPPSITILANTTVPPGRWMNYYFGAYQTSGSVATGTVSLPGPFINDWTVLSAKEMGQGIAPTACLQSVLVLVSAAPSPTPSPSPTPVAGELRPDNATANATYPPQSWWSAYYAAVANGADCTSGICAMSAAWAKSVTASCSGTTTQILQCSAVKYGLDPALVMGDAVQETNWHQDGIGDLDNGISLGILQIKSRDYPETCPTVARTQILKDVNASDCMSHLSTPFAVDYRMAWWANCLDGGAAAYFAAKGRDHSSEGYPAAVKNQDATLQRGCLGAWFSGSFDDANGQAYSSLVQQAAQQQMWTKPAFLKQPVRGLTRPRH